nr:immunoglobulin light chain junction region [Macaca mulatta]MOX28243.1 immunoglobulin light chain junction region [Macaca mulatta]MOX28457.1 immunoglobulin light chain junction region [Macaca mulatta]MOX29115.1 immunoglobulin light chain junction region [Macaca mulatta]MOX30714.1 immunoglobulin light chain junction region [Macaca mulatta]
DYYCQSYDSNLNSLVF